MSVSPTFKNVFIPMLSKAAKSDWHDFQISLVQVMIRDQIDSNPFFEPMMTSFDNVYVGKWFLVLYG